MKRYPLARWNYTLAAILTVEASIEPPNHTAYLCI